MSEPADDAREWAFNTLVRGYHASGHTNPAWDEKAIAAFEAFADYTRVSSTNGPALNAALERLAGTGCDDPMIQYMRVRYRDHDEDAATAARDFMEAHDAMLRSRHHPLFQFMAGLRAVKHVRAADKGSDRSERLRWTTTSLVDTVRDTNAPPEEVFQVINLWVNHSGTKAWTEYVLNHVNPLLEEHWAKTPVWPVLQGRLEIKLAWANRGSDYAHTVTDEGWQGFAEHLAKAEEHLTEAWRKNSSNAEIAYLMMRVELGQGRGRSRMEQWFNRAMTLDTNYYSAASMMSYYLQPRWYGSESETLRFARSCVASDEWGGRVPLVLADLHRSLAKYYYPSNTAPYWQQPHVWPDVQDSYEKFFKLNPDAVGWRHDYARDAFQCGQYPVFLKQTELFSFGTNHAFFGGEAEFDAMIEKARANPAPLSD